MRLVETPSVDVGVYNVRRRAARARGSLLARRRAALRGRLGSRGGRRRLPAPRLELRHPHGRTADAAGLRARLDVCRSRRGRRRRGRSPGLTRARRPRPLRARPPRGRGPARARSGAAGGCALPAGGEDDRRAPVLARRSVCLGVRPRDRRLARLLDDLAGGCCPDPRRGRDVARERPGQVRGVGGERRRGGRRGVCCSSRATRS